MALIQFENLPSTNTAINADNLNNNFNYLKDNVLVASLHNEFEVTINKQYTFLPLSQDLKLGNKLSLVDGGIKIGAGVSYIKIYASMAVISNTTDNKHMRIGKNNDVDNTTVLWRYGLAEDNYANVNLGGYIIVPVNENDIIQMYYYLNSGDYIGGNSYGCRTSLVVETVA